MELIIPTSTFAIIVAFVIAGTVALLIAIDAKDVRQSRILFRRLISVAKIQSRQPVTVIIELTRSATTILPLLDHLYLHDYNDLEVIIIIKHTAGKNAQSMLESYRRKNKISKLRLIKHAKGLTMQRVIDRYATSPLVMALTKDDRLSDAFFADISLDFMIYDEGAIAPRQHFTPGKTLTSGLVSHFIIWSRLISLFQTAPISLATLHPGVVYRRELLINNSPSADVIRAHVSRRAAIASLTTGCADSPRKYIHYCVRDIVLRLRSWPLLIGTLLILVSLVMFVVMYPRDSIMLIAVILVTYTALITRVQMGLKSYSAADAVSLILLAPFGLLFAVIIYLLSLVQLPVSIIRKTISQRTTARL